MRPLVCKMHQEEENVHHDGPVLVCLDKLLPLSRPHFVCLHSLHANVLLLSCSLMANTNFLWAVRWQTRCASLAARTGWKTSFSTDCRPLQLSKIGPVCFQSAARQSTAGQSAVQPWDLSAWFLFFFPHVPPFRTQCGSADLEHNNSVLILKFTTAITLGVGVK